MKTGIVTGSSRGIGLATVTLLTADRNLQIFGTSTSGFHSLDLPNFKCLKLDLSDSRSISDLADQIGNVKIDFLINNAAILIDDSTDCAIDLERLKKTFEVNVFGTIALTEKLLPNLRENAHIINVASDWGSFSEQNFDSFHPHYKLSKTAVNMYTKLLSKRLEVKNVKVSSLDPGWTQTDMGGKIAPRISKGVAIEILNLLSNDVESGRFWHQGKLRSW